MTRAQQSNFRLVAAVAIYLFASFWLLAVRPSGFGLMLLAIQYGILFPACYFYWSRLRREGEVRVRIHPAVVWVAIAVFVCASASFTYGMHGAGLLSDEGAYRFEAKILRTGHLKTAPLPGVTDSNVTVPPEMDFSDHIATRTGWLGKYPLGWPVVLAGAQALRIDWLCAPLLAGIILVVTWRIGALIWDRDTGTAAVLVLVGSPFFLMISVGAMSHPLAGALLALATLCLIEGLARRSAPLLVGVALCLGAGAFVRPFTAALFGAALGIMLLWKLRNQKRFLLTVFLCWTAVFGVTGAGSLVYQKAVTGDYRISPYAFAVGKEKPVEITFDPVKILGHAPVYGRQVILTTLFLFPLLYVFAIYAWKQETRRRAELILLLSLFPLLIAGHLLQTDWDASLNGERYYYEGVFGLALVGARGLRLLAERLPSRALVTAACLFAVLQIAAHGINLDWMNRRVAPYRDAIDLAHSDARSVIFFAAHPPQFFAAALNINDPDWKNSPRIYLLDPGAARRDGVVKGLSRNTWSLIGYDPATRTVAIQSSGRVR
jgi:hypothetical protein